MCVWIREQLPVYGYTLVYLYTSTSSGHLSRLGWNSRQGIESQRSIQHASILTYTHTKIALWPFALNTLLPTERISLLRRQCHRCHCFSPFLTGPCTIVFILFILFNYTEYLYGIEKHRYKKIFSIWKTTKIFPLCPLLYTILYCTMIQFIYILELVSMNIYKILIYSWDIFGRSILKIKMNKCWYRKISLEIYLLN